MKNRACQGGADRANLNLNPHPFAATESRGHPYRSRPWTLERRSPAIRQLRTLRAAAMIERRVSAPTGHHLPQSYQYLTCNPSTKPNTLPHNFPPYRPANARRSAGA
jgi:hypothetical protein